MFPYQWKTYFAGIGESVSLYCDAVVSYNDQITVLWSFNKSPLRLNDSFRDIKTYIEEMSTEGEISSDLDIIFIEDTEFGIFTCSLQAYQFSVEKVYLQHKMAASGYITRTRDIIPQYNVRKYTGKEFYIYATPGGVIDLRWKPMNFNNENEDLIQYYYVNKVVFNRPQNSELLCSIFSSLYVFYGQALDLFLVLYDSTSSRFWMKNQKNSFETRFTECAGTKVFGIHTVVYFRRFHDKKMKSFVMQEVKHPDTKYLQPDLPYFYRIDNATKAKKEIIQILQKMDLNYPWFDNSLTCFLHARVVLD